MRNHLFITHILFISIYLTDFSSITAKSEEIKTFKIICFNVMGISKDDSRYQKFIEFINKNDPDILGLLELNDWDNNQQETTDDFISKTKFKDYIFCKANSDFNLAIFSKNSFILKEVITQKIGHGLIKAKILLGQEKITLLLTHLTPGTEDARLRELDIIFNNFDNDHILFMGDLNSLSILDRYDEKKLLDVFSKSRISKFGTDSIRTDVIKKIMDKGFRDAQELAKIDFQSTVPTPFNSDSAHSALLRLDYFFLSQQLVPLFADYQVLKNNDSHLLSDHYPIMLELKNE